MAKTVRPKRDVEIERERPNACNKATNSLAMSCNQQTHEMKAMTVKRMCKALHGIRAKPGEGEEEDKDNNEEEGKEVEEEEKAELFTLTKAALGKPSLA